MSWLVLWDNQTATVQLVLLNQIWTNILSRIVWHSARCYKWASVFTRGLDLAFEDLICWCDGLTTSALKTIDRELAQLDLTLLVWAFKEAWVMLLDACTLHPVSHFEKEAGTLGLATLLVYDALGGWVENLLSCTCQAWTRLRDHIVVIKHVMLSEENHVTACASV